MLEYSLGKVVVRCYTPSIILRPNTIASAAVVVIREANLHVDD